MELVILFIFIIYFNLLNLTFPYFILSYKFSESSKSIYDGEFPDENYNILHDTPGIIGMVKKGGRKHSNECQFYITLASLQSFDKNFVAFGRIVEGFENIHSIESMESYLQRPTRVIKISSCGEYVI